MLEMGSPQKLYMVAAKDGGSRLARNPGAVIDPRQSPSGTQGRGAVVADPVDAACGRSESLRACSCHAPGAGDVPSVQAANAHPACVRRIRRSVHRRLS